MRKGMSMLKTLIRGWKTPFLKPLVKVQDQLTTLREMRLLIIALCFTSLGVFGIRDLGWTQFWELLTYDQLVRWQVDQPPDPRLLIVTIDEKDLREQKRWPFTDATYARLLSVLQRYHPRAIGLDIYRDFPVEEGYSALVKELEKPNVITIRSIDTEKGTPAPPASPPEQVGFNEFPVDPDGVVRRQLLFSNSPDGMLTSFGLQLAFLYFQGEKIEPRASDDPSKSLQVNQAIFFKLKQNDGGYQTIDAGGYQILLRFRSKTPVAQTVTLRDVFQGNFKPEWIKDKIVLIGNIAPSLKDEFSSPYSRSILNSKTYQQLPGVMIHAHIVSQILDAGTGKRPLFWYWTETQENYWIITWIILGLMIGWKLRHPIPITLMTLLGIVMIIGLGMIVFTYGGWIPVATPTFAFLLSLGTVITHQSYRDHQQHQMVMKLLGQNTSPEIADALWKQRSNLLESGKLPGKLLIATILFLDIKGFSTISETMPPDQLLNWLNELLGIITHEVLHRQGIVNKFTGDGVMAVFGVPMNREAKDEIALDAQRAVNCSISISHHLIKINQDWKIRGLPHIQMRIGIFTGNVVVGSLGGKDRLEYGVIGDSVNIASRLESCEKERQPSDCRILIAEETYNHLPLGYPVESWGDMALKGKEQLVQVYRVLDEKITPDFLIQMEVD